MTHAKEPGNHDGMRLLQQIEELGPEKAVYRVKMMYVDIAGDLIARILLGQIVHWFSPSKMTGKQGHECIKKGYVSEGDEGR